MSPDTRLTHAQRRMIENGDAVPARRWLNRIPADPFPFLDHRTLAEVEADANHPERDPISAQAAKTLNRHGQNSHRRRE